MSTITTIKAITLDALKTVANTAKLHVRKARKTGNLYAVSDNEEYVCSFAKDIDFAQPIVALEQADSSDGSTWWFAINGTPTAPVDIAVL